MLHSGWPQEARCLERAFEMNGCIPHTSPLPEAGGFPAFKKFFYPNKNGRAGMGPRRADGKRGCCTIYLED